MDRSLKRVLIFIVSYNAERFIEGVLKRIPESVWANDLYTSEVLVIDDCSQDSTFEKAEGFSEGRKSLPIRVLFNPVNQGYGGNQKIGYFYAIEKGFDAVVLLHGDGQYAPEYLDDLVRPVVNGICDAVFGSRMMRKRDALKGDMPVYKWVGNQVLTFLQNRILGTSLSEFHSGYRAYSTAALASIPFKYNSDYFDFDTDIIIQLVLKKMRIMEVPIPTFYGKEVSRVNAIRYGTKILLSSIQSRVQRWGVFYHPKFDTDGSAYPYVPKFGYKSSHQFAFDTVKAGSRVLDLGSGPFFMAEKLSEKGVETLSVDRIFKRHQSDGGPYRALGADLEAIDPALLGDEFNTILLLDVIDQLRFPERFLERLREAFSHRAPNVIITTANVGFIMTRLSLLLGFFNYGRRGILDLEHLRLFTFRSLRRTLKLAGFDVIRMEGIPAPFPLAFGMNTFSRSMLWLNKLLISISRSLFSYQIAVVARPRPTLKVLLQMASGARPRESTPTGYRT